MDVYVAESLSDDEEIAFNAGTHSVLVRISCQDYENLVSPKVIAPTWSGRSPAQVLSL